MHAQCQEIQKESPFDLSFDPRLKDKLWNNSLTAADPLLYVTNLYIKSLEAISKKSFRPDLCRPADRFFQLDGLEEASTGGRGSSGVGIP
jgi:hypothetical protein